MLFINQIPKIARQKLDSLLVSSFLIASASLFFSNNFLSKNTPQVRLPVKNEFCQEMVLPKAEITGEQLAKLLTIPNPAERSQVQEVVNQPYCRLPSLSIRAGEMTDRDAYPLAIDPQTWLVVLYEGDNYVGYGFKRF